MRRVMHTEHTTHARSKTLRRGHSSRKNIFFLGNDAESFTFSF